MGTVGRVSVTLRAGWLVAEKTNCTFIASNDTIECSGTQGPLTDATSSSAQSTHRCHVKFMTATASLASGLSPMSIRSTVRESLGRLFSARGYELVPSHLMYPWQKSPWVAKSNGVATDDYLSVDNPRLRDLREKYSTFGGPASAPVVWTDGYVTQGHLRSFRGENGYVWQTRHRNHNELGYALSYYYTHAHDHLRLLDRLTEDGAFGAHVFQVAGRSVSRDLLDSVNELNFLDQAIGLASKKDAVVLDIGAGYGRLAHRAIAGLPSIASYLCTDAVAESTFLCEYYLRGRGVSDRAQAVPLDRIESVLTSQPVDLVVNIHSWPECHPDAVKWWVRLVARQRVPYIFVVTNAVSSERPMCTNRGEDLSGAMVENGYKLALRRAKYADEVVQNYGVSPATYFLWELAQA